MPKGLLNYFKLALTFNLPKNETHIEVHLEDS